MKPILPVTFAFFLGLGTFWIYQKLQVTAAQSSKTPGWTLPDYSGITIDRLVVKDIEKGTGSIPRTGDKLELEYRFWIYDPKAIGNKGPLLLSTQKAQILGELRPGSLSYLVKDLLTGGIREWLIPSNSFSVFQDLLPKDLSSQLIVIGEVKRFE